MSTYPDNLTKDQSRAIRSAITGHPRWREAAASLGYRDADTGDPINAAQLRAAHMPALCDALSIDAHAIVAKAPTQPCKPQPIPAGILNPPGETKPRKVADPLNAAVAAIMDGPAVTLADRVAALAQRAIKAERAIDDVRRSADAEIAQARAQAAPAKRKDGTSRVLPRPIRTASASDVFAISARGETGRALGQLEIECWDAGDLSAAVPAVDPGYVWTPETLHDLVIAERRRRHPWLCGWAGTGKTSAAAQYAARTGRPFIRVPFHEDSSAAELIGAVGVKSGETVWQPGILLEAIQTPGALILLDEITSTKAAIQMMLQPLLDDGGLSVPNEDGDVVHYSVAPGVMIWAADNTAGAGDESGLFTARGTLDQSTIDRFAVTVRVDWLRPSREIAMLNGRTGLAIEACRTLVEYAKATRQALEQGNVQEAVGPRRLLAIADWLAEGAAVDRAFNACLFNRLPLDTREALQHLYRQHIDPVALAAQVLGTTPPVLAQDSANTSTPTTSAAPEFGPTTTV